MIFSDALTFSGTDFNRADHLRDQADDLAQRTDAKVALIWRGKPLLTLSDASLAYVSTTHPILGISNRPMLFLGLDQDVPLFAVDISDWEDPALDADQMAQFLDESINHHPDLPATTGFQDLRSVMTQMSPHDAALCATARGMFEWQKATGFCARCGGKHAWEKSGWQAVCTVCNAPQFPRTDPVVIMLITRGNSTLLGRAPNWPVGMYSCLAGFMEPGETIETAVRREVMEEANIQVGSVRYIASQPWPFPASLMIGCHGEAISTDITIDPHEIDDAVWVTREDMADAYAGKDIGVNAPRAGSIAEYLLRIWIKDALD